jgi:hypothetical protein
MEDAVRTDDNRRTYAEFIESLEEIQQLCPLHPQHTGSNARGLPASKAADLAALAKSERAASLQKNERSAVRSDRLRAREADGKKGSMPSPVLQLAP